MEDIVVETYRGLTSGIYLYGPFELLPSSGS